MASMHVFEIAPVIERLVEGKNATKTKVTALECWEDLLFVGTSDGFLVRYRLEHGESPTGKVMCQTCLEVNKKLGIMKPILQILPVPAEGQVLILCDGRVFLLDMETLEIVEKDKRKNLTGVNKICRDSGSDLSTYGGCRFSMSRPKKGIYHFKVSEGALLQDKEFRELEGDKYRDVISLARDGSYICFAQKTSYSIVNCNNMTPIKLSDFKPPTVGLVTRVSKNEFLLNYWTEGATTGMFVNQAGHPGRPPIQWSFRPTSIAGNYPYIVSLSQEYGEQGIVTVHSILDQQKKQDLRFPEGNFLSSASGKIFIASDLKISMVAQVSFDRQIDELVSLGRIAEALNLAQVTFGSPNLDMDPDELDKQRQKLLAIQRRAGLAYMTQCHFSEGLELLAATNTDPREIISLFPGLLPKSSNYTSVMPTEDIESINNIANTPEKMESAKQALVGYLHIIKNDPVPKDWVTDIDTTLALLFSESNPEKLLELISSDNSCVVEDVTETLLKNERHHALAMMYSQAKMIRRALEIWKKLNQGSITDPDYPGLDFAIESLRHVTDVDLVFVHAEWMLNIDQRAVRVFTSGDVSKQMRPDMVLDFLKKFEKATLEYLEYLVFDAKVESPQYHTQLAQLYLRQVKIDLIRVENQRKTHGRAVDDTLLEASRSKLKVMLQTSSGYDVEDLLKELGKLGLHAETAILYGKLGRHTEALDILVSKLNDHQAAEKYCVDNTRNMDRASRQGLFLQLLGVYLERGSGHSKQALELLNSHHAELNLSQVLEVAPKEWTVQIVDKFLRRSVRQSLHMQRMFRIEQGLYRQRQLQTWAEWDRLTRHGVTISDDQKCCHRMDETSDVFIDATTRTIWCRKCNPKRFEAL
eukprot:m.17221 g.17221  ORF g.17221 m.17221 type:complete len:869 (-) comp5949_c0_seq1:1100-3706(-)